MDIDSIWIKTCGLLKETLSKDVYDRWIAVIEPVEIKNGVLSLIVANDFYLTWLEENYLTLIESAIASSCGKNLSIKLSVDRKALTNRMGEHNASQNDKSPTRLTEEKPKIKKPFTLNPKYSFESFVVGPSNNFAHAAAIAVAQSPARAYNPLFIYGGVGLGKTHLMQAIGHHISLKSKANIRYLSCEAFTNDYIDALQKKGLVQFRKKYRSTDLLLIDDIHFLGGKERMQEEFFHTFNALFDGHKQIVLTCDRPASEIPGLEQRLVSRFEWGLVTELEPPDIETRIAILRNKRNVMNLDISDDILMYIAENIRSNIRRLEGALIRVASYSSLTGKELCPSVLENLLRDTLDQSQQQITMDMIQRTVAEHYDVRLSDMTSRKRPQSVAFPRQIAMYLCRTMTQHSLPTIGNAFCRNHATVLYACKSIEHKIKHDSNVRKTIFVLNNKLTTP